MKKTTKQNLWTAAVLVVVVLAVLVMTRNQVIRNVSRRMIRQSTGFDLEIGRLHVGILKPSFEILDTKLVNPEDFRESEAFDIRRIYVRYDLRSLLSDTVHLPEVYMDIPRIVIVTKEDGEMNIQRLGKAAGAEQDLAPAAPESPAAEGAAPADEPAAEPAKAARPEKGILIGTLTVKLGTASIHSYAGGRERPQVVDAPMNVDRTFSNVTNLDEVVTVLSSEILIRTLPAMSQGLSHGYEENREAIEASSTNLEAQTRALEKMSKGLLGK